MEAPNISLQGSEQQAQPANPPHSATDAVRTRSKIVPLVLVIALGAGGYFAWRAFFATPRLPESIVALSGRVEGDDSAIAPKTSGRILEIRFREGDSVTAGDIIAVLSDDQVRAREEQARAAVSIMEARAKSARDQIAVLQQQLEQNQLRQNSRKLMRRAACVRQRQNWRLPKQIWLSRRRLTRSHYSIRRRTRDWHRPARPQNDKQKQAVSTAGQQAAAVAAANRRVEAARGALTTAKANLANPGIRELRPLWFENRSRSSERKWRARTQTPNKPALNCVKHKPTARI